MKSLAFLSFSANGADSEYHSKCCEVVKWCKLKYSQVYLVGVDSGSPLRAAVASQFPMTELRTNSERDVDYSLKSIRKISPRIKCYSVRLMVNYPFDDFVAEKAFNAHVDYLHRDAAADVLDICANLTAMHDQFAGRALFDCSVLVFDLDDTIIDKRYALLASNFERLFRLAKDAFTHVVLWSHGNAQHVMHALNTHGFLQFDLVLTRAALQDDACGNKGIGYVLKCLNERFHVRSFVYSVLVDDTSGNYVGDYDYFVRVPKYETREQLANFYTSALMRAVDESRRALTA